MDDSKIIDLYWARSENAIQETAAKYGKYCHRIACSILENNQDSEECVNDAYLKVWNAIPPQRPDRLATFLGKITRNLALDRYRHRTAEKRGSGQVSLALDELRVCIPGDTDRIMDEILLTDILNRFLASLSKEQRQIFMRRYWYLSSVREIARDFSITESKVKMSLLRCRNALRETLEKEDISF